MVRSDHVGFDVIWCTSRMKNIIYGLSLCVCLPLMNFLGKVVSNCDSGQSGTDGCCNMWIVGYEWLTEHELKRKTGTSLLFAQTHKWCGMNTVGDRMAEKLPFPMRWTNLLQFWWNLSASSTTCSPGYNTCIDTCAKAEWLRKIRKRCSFHFVGAGEGSMSRGCVAMLLADHLSGSFRMTDILSSFFAVATDVWWFLMLADTCCAPLKNETPSLWEVHRRPGWPKVRPKHGIRLYVNVRKEPTSNGIAACKCLCLWVSVCASVYAIAVITLVIYQH